MNLLMKFSALGISLMLSVWACANFDGDKSARCDHAHSKTHVVKVTLDEDTSEPPSVDKPYVVACFEDEIVFQAKEDAEFSIKFKKGKSPFGKDLGSSKGKAKAKVKENPKRDAKFYKYDVVDTGVPKRPVLDPRIIITPR